MSWFPSIDGQTVFAIVVGALLTLITFGISYRQTIGAKQERIRSANRELVSTVVRRMVIERDGLTLDQYIRIRRAKAYECGFFIDDLITFSMTKSIILSEVLRNEFLDADAKNQILPLLEDDHSERTKEIMEIVKQTGVFNKRDKVPLIFSTVSSLLIGVLGFSLLNQLDTPSANHGTSLLTASGFGTIVVLITVALLLSYIPDLIRRRSKLRPTSDQLDQGKSLRRGANSPSE